MLTCMELLLELVFGVLELCAVDLLGFLAQKWWFWCVLLAIVGCGGLIWISS